MSNLGNKIRFGVLAFALVAVAVGWTLGWASHGWALGVYLAVIAAGLVAGSAADVIGKGWPRGLGPDDLDRPGGPYDRLHHRVK